MKALLHFRIAAYIALSIFILSGMVSCSDDDYTDDLLVICPVVPQDSVLIADENLREALLTLLNTDSLTAENLATITSLTLKSKNYSTLEGISHLVNLDSLTIDNNNQKGFIDFPAEIADMQNLTYLKASRVFKGTLPDSLSGFTYFATAECRLTGNIPPRLMNLDAERIYLGIKSSRFTGMPVDIWRRLCIDTEKYQLTNSVAPQADGYFLTLYDPDSLTNNTYRENGDFELYQTHSKGNGINMFILCDGFDRSCNAINGIAEKVMKLSVEQMFAINPMNNLRDYFDIYLLYVESPEKGMTYSTDWCATYENKVETYFNTHQPNLANRYYLCDTPRIMEYIEENTGLSPFGGVVMLIAHNLIHGGSAGMEYVHNRTSFSVSTIETQFAKTIWHESVGHSIGWLADEYVENGNNSAIPDDTKNWYIDEFNRYDYGRNIAYTDDNTVVWWSDFIGDERYADEEIGCYEGAHYYSKGVWRATENSIMRTYDRDQTFNAPCRAIIWKEIMTRALGDEFTYDYEDFVKFDMQDRYYPLQ